MDDELLAELYAAPLEEFVRTRDALARSLRQEGRRDEAAAVAGVRKPPVPVWAANQLARRNRPAVERALDAGGAMRDAMERGDRDAFVAAQHEHAKALSALRDAARRLLGDATDSTLDRLVETVRAASVDEELRPRLAAGLLEEEPEAGGFGALAGMTVAPPRREQRPGKERRDRERRERVAEAREALRQAKARRRELDATARKAEGAAERARRDADEAAAAVAQAERELAAASGDDR